MEMVSLGPRLIIVFFAVHVHKVQLFDQPMPFQQRQGAVNRDLIEGRVISPGSVPQPQCVQVAIRLLNQVHQYSALLSHAHAAGN